MGRLVIALLVWLAPLANAETRLYYFTADSASEPYQIVSSDEAKPLHAGILTDVLTALAPRLDASLEPVVQPYKRIRLEMLIQRYPGWISYGSPAWLDPRALKTGEYAPVPLLEFHYQLARLKPSPELEGSSSVESGTDITRARVIVIFGYAYSPAFYRWVNDNQAELIYAPNHTSAMAMLLQGRGEFYMAEDVRIRWLIKVNGVDSSQLQLTNLDHIMPPSQIFFLLDRRLPEAFKTTFVIQLRALQAEGEIADIVARYQ